MISDQLLTRFTGIVGEKNALTEADDLTHYTHENRDIVVGKTPLVLKPGSTQEVSEIIKLAAATKTAIVPQGGHTGHVAGGVPDESGTQIVIALERMNRIREVDLQGNVLVCEAGCILETIQNVATENDRLFPLSLGAQGSCQIGGNIATNAGGTGVLAYGNTRALVMGLEVVLPSGEIWNGLRRLKKDNTGYDLKDLFIGSEGTLGIITAAILKLFPQPRGKSVAFCGLETPKNAVRFLNLALISAGSGLTTFELMARIPMEFTFKHMKGVRNPMSEIYPWNVLLEISSNRSDEDAAEIMQAILEDALEHELIVDAVPSSSLQQVADFWRIRETMPTAQKHEGASIKHDIALPVHRIPEFLDQAGAAVLNIEPDARLCTFGHLGDGNLHYNISKPESADPKYFLSMQPKISEQVNRLVVEMDGSIAAEHGVGRLKRDLLAQTKNPTELALMRAIKNAFDPKNIMNPGKLV